MTNAEVVDRIAGLRRITRETGCFTRRAQSNLLASLTDQQLMEVAPMLKKMFDEEKTDGNPVRI
jgi:hypothetical protein